MIIRIAFCLSIVYWFYLGFVTENILFHDAAGYDGLGNIVASGDWTAYFKGSPRREPLYPILIAISKIIGKILNIDFFTIQKLFQSLLLFFTQYLMFLLGKKLKINKTLIAASILYIGLSPSITNSTFRLYSEIMIYPFIPLLVLLTIKTWQVLSSSTTSLKKAICSGLIFGILLTIMTLIKASFELIGFLYVIPFIAILWTGWSKKSFVLFKNTSLFLISFFIIFIGLLSGYKMINFVNNGYYTITNRGPYALYGNTARRTHPNALKTIPTALTVTFGMDLCYATKDKKSCEFWHYQESDKLGYGRKLELINNNIDSKIADKKLVHESIELIKKHPLRTLFFMEIESLKILFWEMQSMAYVVYPDWIEKIYENNVFKYGMRALMGFLSFGGIFWGLLILLKQNALLPHIKATEKNVTLFWTLYAIICFAFIHSFFFVLPRYNFPLISLLLLLTIFTLQSIFRPANQN